MIIGIDATNIGYGGGAKHITELIANFNKAEFPNIEKIVVWGSKYLVDLPQKSWLEVIYIPIIIKGGIGKIIWQLFCAEKEFRSKCDIIFSPNGTFYSKKIKYISMSQNMLIFDNNEAKRYGVFSKMYAKFKLLKFLQKRSFSNAEGVIFISEYAQNKITESVKTKNNTIIYHGNSKEFDTRPKTQKNISLYNDNNPFKIIYISAIRPYKHQITLIGAIAKLKLKYPIELILIGEAEDKIEYGKFTQKLNTINEHSKFIKYLGPIKNELLPNILRDSDLYAMCSTCENMPNILIEAMSAGLPIACSNYSPMPDFLKDAGIYFDPLSENEIYEAVEKYLINAELRFSNAQKSYEYSKSYDWNKCAFQTFEYVNKMVMS